MKKTPEKQPRASSPLTPSKIVTLVIILLILILGALILYSYFKPQTPAMAGPSGVPGGSGQGGGPGQAGGPGNSGGGQAGSGGGSGGQSGGQGGPGGGQARGAGGEAGTATQRPGGGGGQNRTATAVRAEPVFLGNIENHVVINGDVLARTQVAIYPTVGGKLTEARLQVGDWVSQGQTVALVDPSRPGEIYSLSPVVSTISGTVLSAPVNPGDTVNVQTAVYLVGDLSTLRIETFVPERFSTSMRRGLSAQVRFEAMPEEVFTAEVDEVSPVLDPASRTLRIRLRFVPGPSGRQDPRIKVGMFATLTLVTTSRRNVPLVPRGAVINTYGSWIVFVVREDNTAERREIKPGLESEAYFEVLEGLSVGEVVVTAGQNFLSQNDLVRIVE